MGNGEADRGHLPAPAGASSRSRPGEKGNDRSGASDVIAKIKMIAPWIVEIHSPFDQTEPERLGVKVDIALRISRDRGDVMDAGAAHGKLEGERVARSVNYAMNFCVSLAISRYQNLENLRPGRPSLALDARRN